MAVLGCGFYDPVDKTVKIIAGMMLDDVAMPSFALQPLAKVAFVARPESMVSRPIVERHFNYGVVHPVVGQ